MPSIQILYEDDHQDRGIALMNALANDANADMIDKAPVKIKGLKTLVFWGHGNASQLCNRNSKGIIDIIKAWKKLNDDLKNIEIITCNSRHFNGKWWNASVTLHRKSKMMHDMSGKQINDSMVKQVKRGLKYSSDPSLWKMRVLSLPESVRGSFRQYSVLFYNQPTFSWCYVTGAAETEMFTVGACIAQKKNPHPKKGNPDDRWGDPRDGAYPARVAAAKIEFPQEDYRDVIAGKLHELRDFLVEVK